MSRKEFSKATKRAANERAKDRCEAVGLWYGLLPGQRCNAPLGKGRHHDHINMEANSHDNSLENCAAVCIPCHAYKTAKIDIPKAAKTLRTQDKHTGITRPKQTIQQRRVLREVVAKAAGGKGQSAHEAAMAAKQKRIPPRRSL
jgi:hypothetical protein